MKNIISVCRIKSDKIWEFAGRFSAFSSRHHHTKPKRASCLSNVKQLGLAWVLYADEAYFNRSMLAGTVNKTLEWLNKAVDFDPGHYDSREARALTYYALKKYGEMEIDASAMIGNKPTNSRGYALSAIARRECPIAGVLLEGPDRRCQNLQLCLE